MLGFSPGRIIKTLRIKLLEVRLSMVLFEWIYINKIIRFLWKKQLKTNVIKIVIKNLRENINTVYKKYKIKTIQNKT